MKKRKYEFLLLAIIAARATSFMFSKTALETIQPFNLLAVRFILAFLLLAITFRKRLLRINRTDLISGALCGIAFFIVMSCEYKALETSGSAAVSLLENCAIIFVPLFEALLYRRFPKKTAIVGALAAMTGVFCLSAEASGPSGGLLFGLLSAVFYALSIIITGILSRKAEDTLCIGIIQVGTLGFLALAVSFIFETPVIPDQPVQWSMILALAVICTFFGYTLQPVAQRYVSVARAGLFCAISPAIAAILGAVVLHESFGMLSILGLVLILSSIVFPYIKNRPSRLGESE